MKQNYQVRTAFRVGRQQRWFRSGDVVSLLPCEAHYPLQRGWIALADSTSNQTTSAAGVAVMEDKSDAAK